MEMKNIFENFYVPSIIISSQGFPTFASNLNGKVTEAKMDIEDKETSKLIMDFPILIYKLREEILSICKGLETFAFPVYQNWKSNYRESITQYIMSEAKLPVFQITGDTIVQANGKYLTGILAKRLETNDFYKMSAVKDVGPFALASGAYDIQNNGVHIFAKKIISEKEAMTPFVIIHDDVNTPSLSLVAAHTNDINLQHIAAEYGYRETIVNIQTATSLQSMLNQISGYCLQKVLCQVANIRDATANNTFNFSKLLKIVLSYLDGPDNIGYAFTSQGIMSRSSIQQI